LALDIMQGVAMETNWDSTTADPNEEPQPNLAELATFLKGPLDIRSIALSGLFLLAVFGTLYVARSVFMPIVLALLLSFLLAPLVSGLARLHLPTPLGAAIVVLAILAVVGSGAYWLSGPAAGWMEQIPQSLERLETKVQTMKESVAEISKATQQVETLAKGGPEQGTSVVEIQRPPLIGTILNQTLEAGAAMVVTIILLYFLLASGNLFLQKLVRVLPRFKDKRTAVTIVHQVEKDVSLYLLTVTMTNAGLGIAVGMAMYGLGMPNPVLWGVMVGCFNFIPYLGDIASTIVLTLVASLTFDQLGRILLVPAVFFALTSLEGMIVTPLVVGNRLSLNPVAIFIWLLLWGWLWGIPGTLLAVPLLAVIKIICDNIAPLTPIGEFLGD
jgi:predicted PurR-regulated permease PerM